MYVWGYGEQGWWEIEKELIRYLCYQMPEVSLLGTSLRVIIINENSFCTLDKSNQRYHNACLFVVKATGPMI